ncbi:MAG: carbohydrate-binding family 9-like protein [Phycisphaerales bacterium]
MPPLPHDAPTPQHQRGYVCHRAIGAGPGPLDGRLDKPFWAAAPFTEEFVDIEGAARPRPPWVTRAKMLYDDEFLYVGAEMEEPRAWATLTEHDSIVYHDNDIEVFLNPTGDNHQYYELEINALGTVFDLYLKKPYRDVLPGEPSPADHDWNVVGLRKGVYVDGALNDPSRGSRRWSVELAFPWRAFDRHDAVLAPVPPRPGDLWRVNFSRVQWDLEVHDGAYRKVAGRPEQNYVWSPQGIIDMHRPEMWGTMVFAGREDGVPAKPVGVGELAAREVLHRVYYAQKGYFARHQRWAGDLAELGLEGVEGFPAVTMRCLECGWVATTAGEAPGSRVHIREDSRVSMGSGAD